MTTMVSDIQNSLKINCSSLEILGKLKTQGGGHGEIRKAKSLKSSFRIIAKPYIAREDKFYGVMSNSPLKKCIPKYYGCSENNGEKFLLIQDLTDGMNSPCIADLKLGTRSYEVGASEGKKLAQISHIIGTTTATHAIRSVDISIRKNGRSINHWGRSFGRKASLNTFIDIIKLFIPNQRKMVFIDNLKLIIKKLRETKKLFPGSRFYSASLLICYDGDNDMLPLKMSIIDFAHAYIDIDEEGGDSSSSEYDDNTILGLQNLLRIFEETNLEEITIL